MRHVIFKLWHAIGCGAVLVSSIWMASCRSAPQANATVLTVANRLNRTILAIERKDCEQGEAAFAPIEDTRMRPGESLRLALPSTCLDLLARDTRGNVVGRQDDLRLLPGASWVLSR